MTWDGKSTAPFPWHEAHTKIVWEPGACFIVDATGRYDTMAALDFTELLMNRLVESKKLDEAMWILFFDRYFPLPPQGKSLCAERASRFKNLVVVREGGAWRKKPGAEPIASGPIDGALGK